MRGMMIHMDGSRHSWLGQDQPQWDLVVALDDADGRILYAKLVPEEDSLSCIGALEHILRVHGRFSSLYTDRGSHFCRTSEKGSRPDAEQRALAFTGYVVDADLMGRAAKDAIFLHCLPAHRGEEVTADVIDGPQSRVWEQAENRLHVQKALMARLMG